MEVKVCNMTSDRSYRPVANQFVITKYDNRGYTSKRFFQSYDSLIVLVDYTRKGKQIYLDKYYWDYSRTTGKYRNQFLGEDIKTTRKKIKSGEYRLADLNNTYN